MHQALRCFCSHFSRGNSIAPWIVFRYLNPLHRGTASGRARDGSRDVKQPPLLRSQRERRRGAAVAASDVGSDVAPLFRSWRRRRPGDAGKLPGPRARSADARPRGRGGVEAPGAPGRGALRPGDGGHRARERPLRRTRTSDQTNRRRWRSAIARQVWLSPQSSRSFRTLLAKAASPTRATIFCRRGSSGTTRTRFMPLPARMRPWECLKPLNEDSLKVTLCFAQTVPDSGKDSGRPESRASREEGIPRAYAGLRPTRRMTACAS